MTTTKEELETNLSEYNSQIQQVSLASFRLALVVPVHPCNVRDFRCSIYVCLQVEQLLLSEPDNQEYADIFQNLTEVRLGLLLHC